MIMQRILRRMRRDEDGVVLVMSLIVIILASSLSLAVAGAILAQVKPTQLTSKLTRTLAAAEAGIDVVQRQIRKAETTGVLPCGRFEAERGSADGSSYHVEVRYYNKDPTGKPERWLEQSSHWITCPDGGLTVASDDQWWALVSSEGQHPVHRARVTKRRIGR